MNYYFTRMYICIITDIDVRSRVWKRKYYHDLQHKKEQLRHTRTSEQMITEKGNKVKKKNSRIKNSDQPEIVTSEDSGSHSGIIDSLGNDFIDYFVMFC